MDYRKLGLGIGAFVGATAALLGGAVLAESYARRKGASAGDEADDTPAPTALPEHVPTDLTGDHQPGAHDRAPPAFRPDMDARMSAAEREALRPATGPGPSLVTGIPNVAGLVPRRE